MRRLQSVELEVVPGITAALAAAASLKQSLTLRGVSRSVAFSTQAKSTDSTHLPLPTADTLVIYMGRDDAAHIAAQLIDQGRSEATPVRIIESISTSRERSLAITLGQMADGLAKDWFDGQAPALLLVGAVFGDRIQYSQVLTNGRLSA
jgi:uroporphyrin-III C-methyltransferase